MQWLQSLYPLVRQALRGAVPEYWPEFLPILDGLIGEPMIPEAMLPLAACRAVGGEAGEAVYAAAAITAAAVSLRILDDIQDRDRPGRLWDQIGAAQAGNFASALHTLCFKILGEAPLSADVRQRVIRCCTGAFFQIAYGQDRDLSMRAVTIDDYWRIVERKIACGYSAACAAGALIGTENGDLVQACGTFGYHLGFAIQIFNDLESIWRPDGVSDLQRGKITLPLLYGLSFDHPERDELIALSSSDISAVEADRIKAILDHIDTRAFLIWSALKEREEALVAVEQCPDAEGRAALESYITSLFGDIDSLLAEG